jgi:lysozyme
MRAVPATLVAINRTSEGCRLTAYQDTGGVWTIGWGQTGDWVHEGLTCTQEQADAWELARLQVAVDDAIAVCPVLETLPDDCLTAIADFAYNAGKEHLATSTLAKRINSGAFNLVPAELNRWIYDNGKIQRGLITRREQEGRLWVAGLSKRAPSPDTDK